MSENKTSYNKHVYLFFSTVIMMCFQNHDISPYQELLDNFNKSIDELRKGNETTFISLNDLEKYVDKVNKRMHNIEIEKNDYDHKLNFILFNYQKGIKTFIYFSNNEKSDFSSNETQSMTSRINDISMIVNNEEEDDLGFSGPNSKLYALFVNNTKLSKYSSDRLNVLSHLTIVNHINIIAQPFNHILQSQIKEITKKEYKEITNGESKSNFPSITCKDTFMNYNSIKADTPTKIYRAPIATTDFAGLDIF